jgi:hypothetical protein
VVKREPLATAAVSAAAACSARALAGWAWGADRSAAALEAGSAVAAGDWEDLEVALEVDSEVALAAGWAAASEA